MGVLDLKELDRYLGPYPHKETPSKYWPDLTGWITKDMLVRVLPLSWAISSQTPSSEDDELTTDGNEVLSFTRIDLKRTWRQGAVGRELTMSARDKSWALQNLVLSRLESPQALLGELQLGFVLLLYLSNFSGFEVWKTIVHLLCNCYSALAEQEMLFVQFIDMLEAQLLRCPDDFFNDVISENNFVATMLRNMNKNIKDMRRMDSGALASLEKRFQDFTRFLQTHFNWDVLESNPAPANATTMIDPYDTSEPVVHSTRNMNARTRVLLHEDEADEDPENLPVVVDF